VLATAVALLHLLTGVAAQDPAPAAEDPAPAAQDTAPAAQDTAPAVEDPANAAQDSRLPLVLRDPFEGRTVASIAVEGAERYSEERLRAALGLAVGDPYSTDVVEQGIEYLWTLFQVRANLEGKIREDGGLDLRLAVVELPADLEPRFIGNEEVELETLLEWAQLQDRRELYFHQVPRATSRLLEGYHRLGHYFAQVRPVIKDPREGDDPDAPGDVIFEIVEGPRVNVSEVIVHGNASLPDSGALFWKDGLKHLSSTVTAGPSLFDWNGEDFVEETLRADLVAMRNVYRDRGFLNAVVDIDRLEFSEDKEWVDVHIIVDEGPPFRVTKVEIEGYELSPNPLGSRYMPLEGPADLIFPVEELLDELVLLPGKDYEKTWVQADRYALRDFYGKRGYIEHDSLGDRYTWKWLEPELVFDIEKAEVGVTYRIAQGKQIRIREVLIAGPTHTRDEVIRREISVEEGQQADMKEILASLRRLNNLKYFSDERNPLEHRDPYFRFVPVEGAEGQADIEFIVEEGRVVDFAISGGVDSNDGLFGLLSLSMANFDISDLPDSFLGSFGEIYRKEAFHGAGQTLSIQVSPGARRDQSQIRFVEPDIFGLQRNRWSFATELSVFDRIYEFNDEKRTSASVDFGRQLGYDAGVSVGLVVRALKVDDVENAVLLDPELFSLTQEIGKSNLNGLTFGVNFRSTDTAFNPKSGRILGWNNELALDVLGSDWELWTSRLGWDEYIRLGSELEPVPPGLRLSAGLAIVLPMGETDVVPYSERLFLGGYTTLRGFRYRGVGPNSAARHVLGGESMARASLEYRYPLVTQTRPGSYQEIEMFRFHVFVDAGVLGTEYDNLNLGDMRSSAGFGFALLYPIPLAFNFGWPIEDGHGDRRQVFSFNIAIR
jgi:outer membrane protein assembly factor BamA